ncbi:MAG TPA: cytochrome o ubiquinol oxidase subunit IV [Candidatus Saccharimonadales bacterium]|nr:cytochrome o ubiquinol oxidase subunit IV [Candidatus Saccharimonadales bacterium]
MSSNPKHHTEHGTTASYIVGFILSLLFTIIPYLLVTKHKVSGTSLLATVLGFALLQMIIQLVFFLHLGREKKPYWQSSFLVATVGLILVVVVGSLWIMHHLHYNMVPTEASKKLVNDEAIYQIGGEQTGACQTMGPNHQITIKDGQISPTHIAAQKCDTLSFVNQDDEAHHIMFGSFEEPQPYAGEDMLSLRKGRAKTITLSEQGTHTFHDHMHPETSGGFTVLP